MKYPDKYKEFIVDPPGQFGIKPSFGIEHTFGYLEIFLNATRILKISTDGTIWSESVVDGPHTMGKIDMEKVK